MSLRELSLIALVVALLALGRRAWHVWAAAADREWLPMELKHARLVYAERLFRAAQPLQLVARVDRGYQRRNGSITLVELKTRASNRPYFSDVIELSAQRLAVEAHSKSPVSEYGYVVVKLPGSRRKTAHRVKLLTNEAVIALARRRQATLANPHAAAYAHDSRICHQCAFLKQCKPPDS